MNQFELKTQFTEEFFEDEVEDKYYLTQKMYDCVMKPASKGW